MLKIGLIDRYFDNWHTNYYPGYLRDAIKEAGMDADLCYVYAMEDAPGGMTSTEWNETYGHAELLDSYEAIIEKSDALMFMCADDVFPHEALARKALMSGKRLYCDKTFAPDTAAARRMFRLAKDFGTQVFTCSAQRWCPDLSAYMESAKAAGKQAQFCATTGPGEIRNYSVHQLEMIERVMGIGAVDCMAFPVNGSKTVVYRYADGRRVTMVQSPNAVFSMVVSDDFADWNSPNKPTNRAIQVGDFYNPFMHEMLKFFAGGELPVKPEDTMELIAMQEAARNAIDHPETWCPLPDHRI
ncbi:MAG: hypothetical protein MJ175_00575 [Clostridia bacterium]|nr:hypothetical protein [Clostridia bacterium]